MSNQNDTGVLLFVSGRNSVDVEIGIAQRGSDIHGLIEKMAYHNHLANPSYGAERNWFEARGDLIRWANHHYRCSDQSVEENLHELLENYAYTAYELECHNRWTNQHNVPYENPSAFDAWMRAQDSLARQVLWQARNITSAAAG